jgi:hypothetical protein
VGDMAGSVADSPADEAKWYQVSPSLLPAAQTNTGRVRKGCRDKVWDNGTSLTATSWCPVVLAVCHCKRIVSPQESHRTLLGLLDATPLSSTRP